ncbi:hypothetical protein [Nonomuraea sp. SYSU D8015]|uniref:hypothetical protein n=1 Tax=Nonomuraea sp. SYSU D8015 TaxID=2593644 RepID=UPI0016610CCA|nr:hypothetical protein [Nonomuraea sp. SYSU D8015]
MNINHQAIRWLEAEFDRCMAQRCECGCGEPLVPSYGPMISIKDDLAEYEQRWLP